MKDFTRKELESLVELAWGIIANVSGGDWIKQSKEWQWAAHKWGVAADFRLEYGEEFGKEEEEE